MRFRLPRKKARWLLLLIVAGIVCAWGGREWLGWRRRQAKIQRVEQYRELIWKYASLNALPSELVRGVILHESGGDRRAVSPKKARGLMQITAVTETEVLRRTGDAKGDLFDAEYNIHIGTAYLGMLMKRFDGDTYLVLAAYNAGPTRIAKLRRAHPDLTSRELVDKYAPRATVVYCRRVIGEL